MNMKQVVVDNQSGAVAVNEVPLPVINGRGIVVQSLYSVISSGTELSMIRSSRAGKLERLKKMMPEDGLAAYFRRKIQSGTLFQSTASVARSIQRGNQGPGGRYLPLGYSLSGIVQAVDGNVAGVSVGDKVACGGARHADRNYVPLNLFTRIPEAVDPRESAFTTIGCIALQGVRRARLAHGETVAVIGQGLIGQLVTQLVKINGGAVIATDISRRKLGMSLRMGADQCINSAECDPVQEILNYTGGQGVDAAIICAASATSAPLRQALAMVRDKGRIVLVGAVKIEMPRDPLYTKELDFFISRSYGPGRYDPVYEQKGFDYPFDQVRWTENRNMEEINRLLAAKRLNVRDLITHEFAVSDAAKAYETIAREPDAALGILLCYGQDDAGTNDAPTVYPAAVPAAGEEKCIRTAIIGCGSFARKYHLPNIRKIPALRLEAIVTATGLSARQIAETYTIPSCTTDYRALLSRQDIDAVVISTRHHLHATMAQEALAAGKHVFLEKPMALNKDELRALMTAWNSQVRWPWGERASAGAGRSPAASDQPPTGQGWRDAATADRRTASGSVQWAVIEGLGPSGRALALEPARRDVSWNEKDANAPTLEFDFNSQGGAADAWVDFLPTFRLYPGMGLRVAVSVDDGASTLVEVPGSSGAENENGTIRSRAVQDNYTRARVPLPGLAAGRHTLKIRAVDPGVVIDCVSLP